MEPQMKRYAVIDTNVLAAALLSKRGASYLLLQQLELDRLGGVLSVPLFLEYQEVVGRFVTDGHISAAGGERILDYLCAHSRLVEIHYLWRPFLNDPDDEMVLEAALAGGVKDIVTYNQRDFAGTESMGVRAVTPSQILKEMEVIP